MLSGSLRDKAITITVRGWDRLSSKPGYFIQNTMSAKHVAILLGTRNGNRFLREQLQSYARQSHEDWSLYVSDDGSSDSTRDTVTDFASSQETRVTLRDGPRQGFCINFMSLAQDPAVGADYFAFSDQDDVWLSDKLERALAFLDHLPSTIPTLYCSRTRLVDEERRPLGLSPLFIKAPSFQNALVQNIGGGNTMVFNAAAKKIVESIPETGAVSHDWWLYQIISGVGGVVIYDPEPSLEYRQHAGNILGSNAGLRARLRRLRMLLSGRMKRWNDTNIGALELLRPQLTPINQAVLDDFIAARGARPLPRRLHYFRKSGVYRQSRLAQLGLFLAVCLRKI